MIKKILTKIYIIGYKIINARLIFYPIKYNKDGLTTTHNADFLYNKKFMDAYKKGKATNSWGADIEWRALIGCWCGSYASKLKGDYVECGVNKGGLAKTIMTYINWHSEKERTFYLLDTFCGLSDKYITSKEKEKGMVKGGYDYCYNEVVETFKEYNNVKIIKGTVPDTLNQVKTNKVAYLHIDMNCVIPEIAALEYFWDSMVDGGIILLDDYGFTLHIEQKKAFDNFANKKNYMILQLPTGQGIIIKNGDKS